MRVESNFHPLISKVRLGFTRAVADAENEADRNLGSSRANAVYTTFTAGGRAKINSGVPYGLIRQWGGVIRARNPSGYLTFQTRQGNWVRTRTSRQKGNQWLSRAGLSFGRHMTNQLRKLG